MDYCENQGGLIFYKTKSDSSIGVSVHNAIQVGIEIGEENKEQAMIKAMIKAMVNAGIKETQIRQILNASNQFW